MVRYFLDPHNKRHSILVKIKSAARISLHCDNVYQLFQTTSETSYNDMLKELAFKSDSHFEQYFMKNIHWSISRIGRWILEELGIYNPYGRVTIFMQPLYNYILLKKPPGPDVAMFLPF